MAKSTEESETPVTNPVEAPVVREEQPDAPSDTDAVYEHVCTRTQLAKQANAKWPEYIHSWVQDVGTNERRGMTPVTELEMGLSSSKTPVSHRSSILVRQDKKKVQSDAQAREARSIRNMQRTMTDQEEGGKFAKININKIGKAKTILDMQT
jgi:hypothetical protein